MSEFRDVGAISFSRRKALQLGAAALASSLIDASNIGNPLSALGTGRIADSAPSDFSMRTVPGELGPSVEQNIFSDIDVVDRVAEMMQTNGISYAENYVAPGITELVAQHTAFLGANTVDITHVKIMGRDFPALQAVEVSVTTADQGLQISFQAGYTADGLYPDGYDHFPMEDGEEVIIEDLPDLTVETAFYKVVDEADTKGIKSTYFEDQNGLVDVLQLNYYKDSEDTSIEDLLSDDDFEFDDEPDIPETNFLDQVRESVSFELPTIQQFLGLTTAGIDATRLVTGFLQTSYEQLPSDQVAKVFSLEGELSSPEEGGVLGEADMLPVLDSGEIFFIDNSDSSPESDNPRSLTQ